MPALSIRRIVEIQSGARLWPDERTAWRAFARGSLRPGDDGILRDEKNQDVLLFIDNIFRFSQAGSESIRVARRTPSAVDISRRWPPKMGDLQERITSTHKGSITSFQAVYVPADDLTDPAPANTFALWIRPLCLNVRLPSLGFYPAVDPLASTSRRSHQKWSVMSLQRCSRCAARGCSATKICRISLRILGMDELSPEDKLPFIARQIQRFLSQPFHVAEVFTGHKGQYVPIAETVRGFKEIRFGQSSVFPRESL